MVFSQSAVCGKQHKHIYVLGQAEQERYLDNRTTCFYLNKFPRQAQGLASFPLHLTWLAVRKWIWFFALHLTLKGDNIHGFRNRQCFSLLTWKCHPEKPQRPWLTYSMLNYVLSIYRSFSPRLHYNFAVCHKCKMSFSTLWCMASVYYISIKLSNIYYGFITLRNDFLQLPMWSHYHSNSVIFLYSICGFLWFRRSGTFSIQLYHP